jgi:uncharacterized Zn-binding protein involved in type VI secretion
MSWQTGFGCFSEQLTDIKAGKRPVRNLSTRPLHFRKRACADAKDIHESAHHHSNAARPERGLMRRYTITLGAATTSGGKVMSASAEGRIDGVPIALEGDLVTCPVCNTAGKIACVGPRIPESWHGKNVALENDLCVCRCAVPPKLLPNQTLRSQVIKDTGRALSGPVDSARRAIDGQGYTERFRLIDEHTGAPLANQEYALVRASGKLEFGTSDFGGHTHLLSLTAYAEPVEIYAQGPMMSAALISPSGAVLQHRARHQTTPANGQQAMDVRLRLLRFGPGGAAPQAVGDELVTFLPESGD